MMNSHDPSAKKKGKKSNQWQEEVKKNAIRRLYHLTGHWLRCNHARQEIESKASRGVQAITIIYSEKELDVNPTIIAEGLFLQEVHWEREILKLTNVLNIELREQP